MPPSSSNLLPKVARLLDHLAEHGSGSATQIADALREPRSSMYRLLRQLGELGWIEPADDPGSWRIGPALARLGAAGDRGHDLVAHARPHEQRLNAVTEQTVYLCVRRELAAVCLDRLDGLRVADLTLLVGGSLPLHAGASPQVLLAFAPEEIRSRWRAESRGRLRTWTPYTAASRAEAQSRIEAVREEGYAVTDQDITIGIASIAAPVRDRAGLVVAALGISGPREILLGAREELVAQVTGAADALSSDLGHRPD